MSFEGNLYSVPPGLPGAQVRVLHRLGRTASTFAPLAGP
ncbi:hypothetical protein ACFYW6_37275 [Streptomyces sp. NPDC002659]